MTEFNDIGISRQLDWARIRKLLAIGLFGALLHAVGDLWLGWGREDTALEGAARMLSAYLGTPDTGIFASALLGLFGMTLEGLCCFGVYRLMAGTAPAYAHRYRAGIFGYLMFGACGYHVPVCALVFLTRHGLADALLRQYLMYFVLPAIALFCVFFLVLAVTQIQAFAKGLTPYPKWCWVFSMPVGGLVAWMLGFLGNAPVLNAVACAWLAIGNLWMYGGLLALLRRVRN